MSTRTTDQRNKEASQKYLDTLKDKPLFCDTQGRLVSAGDDTRIVWFSANCTYWTDNWNKLVKSHPGTIPACPNCHCPGLQCEYKDWIRSAKRYEDHVAPDYVRFILGTKEKCTTTPDGKIVSPKIVYQHWYRNNQKGINSLNNALSDGINKVTDSQS